MPLTLNTSWHEVVDLKPLAVTVVSQDSQLAIVVQAVDGLPEHDASEVHSKRANTLAADQDHSAHLPSFRVQKKEPGVMVEVPMLVSGFPIIILV